MSEAFKELVRKRGPIKGGLTLFVRTVDSLSNSAELTAKQINELKLRQRSAVNLLQSFNSIQYAIEELVDEKEYDKQLLEREMFESSYYSAMATIECLLENQKVSNTISDNSHNCGSKLLVKLPTISLPSFDGSYENWLEFRDTYLSMIHNSEELDDIQRFHYLRSALTGNALQVIKSLEFSASNYKIAWDLIEGRYDNKNLLVHNHVKSIFSVQPLTKESAAYIRKMVDSIVRNLRALKTLGEPIEYWDTLLIYIIVSKFDAAIDKEWQQYKINYIKTTNKTLQFDTLIDFLKEKAEVLDLVKASHSNNSNSRVSQDNNRKQTSKVQTFVSTQSNQSSNKSNKNRFKRVCAKCEGNHPVYACSQFLSLSPKDKLNLVESKNLCLNCLRVGHSAKDCFFGPCRQCNEKHNSLLHEIVNNGDTVSAVSHAASDLQSQPAVENSSASLHSSIIQTTLEPVLLSTAVVEVAADNSSQYIRARALLDSGSQHCLISNSFCKKIRAEKLQSTYKISGIGQTVTNTNEICYIKLRSLKNNHTIRMHCLAIPQITSTLPASRLASNLNIPENIDLADPSFCTPSQIDILIGANYFWDLLLEGRIRLPSGPFLNNTKLGWIVSGPVHTESLRINQVQCNFGQISELEVNDQLKRFWEIEEISPGIKSLCYEDRLCEKLFNDTTKRDDNGRFSVRIPLKESPNTLGDSYNIAKGRFMSLENKLQRQPHYRSMYVDFMREYEKLGHMTRIEDYSMPCYFLPHHGVFREHSTTTKLRVVFNGSQKTSSGKSLNDIQWIGPPLQNDIFVILLRFRQYQYVACADIEKMFRQISIHEDQRKLQLILWRENMSDPLSVYRLNTVTYGTASAPYLSIRCVRQLALDCSDPEIARIILENMYVDDLLMGDDNKSHLSYLCKQVSDVLNSGCLPLRKWVFNSPEVASDSILNENSKELMLDENQSNKTLGLGWLNYSDQFHFTTKIKSDTCKITKRFILSVVSQIYDPLGLLSPIVIVAKALLQKLWLCKTGWDEPLPPDVLVCWHKFVHSLIDLHKLRIPRHVIGNSSDRIELHVFTDASQTAYGACAFIRSVNSNDDVTVRLLCSKTRVAPLKPVTIPRLELCGALIGARLQSKIIKSMHINFDRIIMWTDSTIVLGWLRMSPHSLKVFVQNRIVEINDLMAGKGIWCHVDGKSNPADLLSRGTSLAELSSSNLWWRGPDFLLNAVANWDQQSDVPHCDNLPELKSSTVCMLNNNPNNDLVNFNRYSSFIKIQRVYAYVFRFVNNRKGKSERSLGTLSLSVTELNRSLMFLTRIAQLEAFPAEYSALINKHKIKSSSKLSSLNIFLDENNLLRVGGRLCNSDLPFDQKHPMLLCSKHPFTILLFKHNHVDLLHAGPQLLLSHIRQRWWIIGGRNLAKKIVHQCVRCCRMKAKSIQPIMGNLPSERFQPGFPFIKCGVDYAGPMYVLNKKGKGSRLEKCYLCLFVCLSTRALHLELVTSLSSEGYILALKRFISRRGKPSLIYSDHGRNFVGAAREFSDFLQNSCQGIIDYASNNQIEFKFIPPYAPHFGGLWEAGVKSCKHHITRVIGKAHLTYEEFNTVLVQIEAVLNSRPMHPMSVDPDDLAPLTPGHFLIGRPLTAPAGADITVRPAHVLTRYLRVEQLRQHFWKRWATDYISELQRRVKWKENHDTLTPGSLVLLKEDNLPPLKWRLGRILLTYPGRRDRVSRVARIKTATGVVERAFSKICPLPISSLLPENGDDSATVESNGSQGGPVC